MDSRTALLNAPRFRRRIAACVLPLLVAGAAAALALAAYASLDARARALADKRARLGQLQQIASSLPGAAAEDPLGTISGGPEFLEGGSDALVQAAFQTRLREIASSSGAEVLAVGNTPIVVRRDARFAGLRTSISGPNDAIMQTIFGVETSEPYLTIRTARINTYPSDHPDGGPPELMLQMQFEGALPTEGEAAPRDPGAAK